MKFAKSPSPGDGEKSHSSSCADLFFVLEAAPRIRASATLAADKRPPCNLRPRSFISLRFVAARFVSSRKNFWKDLFSAFNRYTPFSLWCIGTIVFSHLRSLGSRYSREWGKMDLRGKMNNFWLLFCWAILPLIVSKNILERIAAFFHKSS